MIAVVALTAGAGDLTLKFGSFAVGDIGTATFGAIRLYHVLCSGQAEVPEPERANAANSAVERG